MLANSWRICTRHLQNQHIQCSALYRPWMRRVNALGLVCLSVFCLSCSCSNACIYTVTLVWRFLAVVTSIFHPMTLKCEPDRGIPKTYEKWSFKVKAFKTHGTNRAFFWLIWNLWKTVESNTASPSSRKYCPLTAACILSFHLNATMKSSPNYVYVNLWNIQYPTQEPKDISPSSTTPWPTSKTTNKCVLFFLCCELCIV